MSFSFIIITLVIDCLSASYFFYHVILLNRKAVNDKDKNVDLRLINVRYSSDL
jgi:hypothetical protein